MDDPIVQDVRSIDPTVQQGQSPMEGGPADNAQLLQEIASASDTPIPPNKWNSGTGDSPRQTLLKQYQAQNQPKEDPIVQQATPQQQAVATQTPDDDPIVTPAPQQQLAPSMMDNLKGGLAATADIAAGVVQPIAAGLGALGRLATGSSLSDTVAGIQQDQEKTTPSNIAIRAGANPDVVHGSGYQAVMGAADWLGTKALPQAVAGTKALVQLGSGAPLDKVVSGINSAPKTSDELVQDAAQSAGPILGPTVAAAGSVGAAFIPWVLGAKAVEGVSSMTIRPNIDTLRAIGSDPTVNPVNGKPVVGIPLDQPRPGDPILPLSKQSELALTGENQLMKQTPYGDLTTPKVEDANGIVYDPALTDEYRQTEQTPTMQDLGVELSKADPDIIPKQLALIDAEKENDFRSQEQSPEAKQQQIDQLWAMNEITNRETALQKANDQQHMIDIGFDQDRPTAMQVAMAQAMVDKTNTVAGMAGKLADILRGQSGAVLGDTMDARAAGRLSIGQGESQRGGPKFEGGGGKSFMERLAAKQENEDAARKMRMDATLAGLASPHLYQAGERVRLNDGRSMKITSKTLNAEAAEPAYHGDIANPRTGMSEGNTLETGNGRPINEDQIAGRFGGPKGFVPKGERGAVGDLGDAPKGWWRNYYDPSKATLDASKMVEEGNKSPRTTAILGRLTIPADQFIEAFKEQFGDGKGGVVDMSKTEHDMWYNEIGMTSDTFQTMNRLISDEARPAQVVAKYVWDMLKNHNEMESGLKRARKEAGLAINNVYGLGSGLNRKGPGGFKIDRVKHNIGELLKMEADPGTWFDGENYHPSADQLRERGFTPEEIGAWQKVFDAQDLDWQLAQDAARINGKPLPPRVPGYMTHAWRGAYKVTVKRIGALVDEPPLGQLGAFTLKEAQTYMKSIKDQLGSDGDKFSVELEQPSTIGNDVNATLKGLFQAKGMLGNNSGMQALIKSIYDSATRGLITSMMDRKSQPMWGHILERVGQSDGTIKGEIKRLMNKYLYTDSLGITKPDPAFGLTRSQIKQATQIMRNTSDAVVGYYARARFVNDVLGKLDEAGMLPPGSKLADFVQTATSTWFGIPDKILKQMNYMIRDDLIRSGRDPALGDMVGNAINSGFAKAYLLFNLRYYITNSLSGLGPAMVLHSYKAMGLVYGEQTGSVTQAMTSFLRGDKYGYLQKAAADLGKSNPSFLENLDPGQFKDMVAGTIEHQTREKAFMLGYHYFSQFMDEKAALRTAGEFANLSTVPFDPKLGRPMAFSALPDFLKPVTLFGTFNNHMFSLASMTGRIAAESIKAGNSRAVVHALGGALGLQAINMGLYGLQGAVMMPAYNEAANTVNYFLGSQIIPNTTMIGRWIGKTLNSAAAGAVASYGGVSSLLGYDLSSSGRGAVMELGGVGVDAMKNVLALAILSGRKLLSMMDGDITPPSQKDWWQQFKTLPSTRAGPLEYFTKNKNPYSDTLKQIMGQMPDSSIGIDPQTGMQDPSLKGEPRSQGDTAMRFLFGMKSIRESEMNETRFIETEAKKDTEEQASRNLQLLKEGNQSPEKQSQLILNLVKGAYKDPDEVINALIDYRMKGNMTDSQRRAMGSGDSLESLYWYQRYLKQQAQEPSRTSNGSQ